MDCVIRLAGSRVGDRTVTHERTSTAMHSISQPHASQAGAARAAGDPSGHHTGVVRPW